MKSLTLCLILAAFALLPSASAQRAGAPPPSTGGGSATDDAASSISTIHRPTPAPTKTSAAVASGPKKPLEVSLSKDAKEKGPETAFPAATTKIYLHYDAPSAVKGEKLHVVWIAEDAKGISTKNKKLTESNVVLPGPVSNGDFYLPASATGFPVGKYRAEVYEDGKLFKSLKFTIGG